MSFKIVNTGVVNPEQGGDNVQKFVLPASAKRLVGFYIRTDQTISAKFTIRDSYNVLLDVNEVCDYRKTIHFKKKLRTIQKPARGNTIYFVFNEDPDAKPMDIQGLIIHAELEY